MKNYNIQKNFYNKVFEKKQNWNDSTLSSDTKYFTERFLNSIIKPGSKNILEIGCGNGLLTYFLLKRNLQITAIDISDKAIENLQNQFNNEISQGKLKLVCQDLIEFMENGNEKYDIIIGSGIIHHIEREYWEKLFSLAYKKLVPGGIFACGPEPNAGGIYHIIWHFAGFFYKLFGINYEWEVEKGTLNMIPKNLRLSVEKAGFQNVEIFPYQLIPHFHLKFFSYLDKKIINQIKGKFSLYITIRGEK